MVLVGVVFDHTQQGSVQSGGFVNIDLVQLVSLLQHTLSDESDWQQTNSYGFRLLGKWLDYLLTALH